MASSILGAVLAGGLSSRFGSDKALALLDGERLIDHAVATLASHCQSVIVVGRSDPRHRCVPDWPTPHLGPLGGFAGALNHALEHGYAAVLTCGVDSLALPNDLLQRLSPAPAFLQAQPVVGLWPAQGAGVLEEILFSTGKHSVMRFADAIRARPVRLPVEPVNVNYPEDLASLQQRDV